MPKKKLKPIDWDSLYEDNFIEFKLIKTLDKNVGPYNIQLFDYVLANPGKFAKLAKDLSQTMGSIRATEGKDSLIFQTLQSRLTKARHLLRLKKCKVLITRRAHRGAIGAEETRYNTNPYKLILGVQDKVDKQLKAYRQELRYVHKRTIYFQKNEFLPYLVSRGNEDTGVILALQKAKKMHHIFLAKKPTTPVNHVGVELEFCSKVNKTKVAEALYNAGLVKYCSWHEDRSLRPKLGENGHELSILAEESEINKVVTKVSKILVEIGAETKNRRCGFHVHFDMRNRNKELVYNNLVACQRWLAKMVAPDRRNGEFSKNVKSRKWPKKFSDKREERYKSINAAAFYKHSTLEIRLHEATIDAKLINNWIAFLLKIVRYKKALPKNATSLNMMFQTFNMDKKMQEYATDRIIFHKLNNEALRLTLEVADDGIEPWEVRLADVPPVAVGGR